MSPSPLSHQLPNPPGIFIQKINAILHGYDGHRGGSNGSSGKNIMNDGPIIAYVFYMCYWCTMLGIVTPTVVFIYLPLQCTIQIIRYLLTTYRIIPNTNYTYDLLSSDENTKDSSSSTSSSLEMCIVITGCDTGFGKELALYAANELGYTVFAGCLHPQSSWNITNSDNNNNNNHIDSTSTTTTTNTTTTSVYTKHGQILPIPMDVTNSKQVLDAVQQVQQWLLGNTNNEEKANAPNSNPVLPLPQRRRVLHALINNAGVGRGSIIDWSNQNDNDGLSDHHYCMDVNYFGMIRCCKAFLPLFKKQSIEDTHKGGRIINITSMAGYISNGVMGSSPYIASKHAANAFSHVLRTELISRYHIQVCTINPSFHKTPLVDTLGPVLAKTWEALDPKLKDEYGEEYYQRLRKSCVDLPQRCKWDMDVVVQQVIQCLRRKDIPPEIIIGTDAKYILMLLRMIPYDIIDFITRKKITRRADPPVPAIMTNKKKTAATTTTTTKQ